MRAQFLGFVLVAALGCSAPTRTVTGQIATSTQSLVVAQSLDHQKFSSSVTDGRFTLQLPAGASYTLNLGSARIDWPTATGPARWAKLGSGPTLDLGHVSKSGDHFTCDHQGSDDDHCDDDDDHGDDGDGHECDGGTHTGGGGSGGGGAGGAGGGSGDTGGGGIN